LYFAIVVVKVSMMNFVKDSNLPLKAAPKIENSMNE
jgi:hypothetical protein